MQDLILEIGEKEKWVPIYSFLISHAHSIPGWHVRQGQGKTQGWDEYLRMIQNIYLKCRAGFDWVEVNVGDSDGLATSSTCWYCSLRNSCPYAFCLSLRWLPVDSRLCHRWIIPEFSVRDVRYWRQFICIVKGRVVIRDRLCRQLCNRGLVGNLSVRLGESGGYDEFQKSLCIFKRRHVAKGYSHRTSGTSIN